MYNFSEFQVALPTDGHPLIENARTHLKPGRKLSDEGIWKTAHLKQLTL